MSKTNFQDLSTGSKGLLLIEFSLITTATVACFLTNKNYTWIDQSPIPTNILVIYTIIFSLATQLSMLSLGLYNPRMRKNFRTIFRRLALSFSIGYVAFTVLSSLFAAAYTINITLLAYSSFACLMSTTALRFIVYKADFLGLGKRKILVLGAGKRAAIIEKRMRRSVDRQNFNLLGFITVDGDCSKSIQKETKFELKGESLVSFARRHNIDEIVVACDERRGNLPTDELFACKIRGINIIEIMDFIERETGQVAVNLIYPSWVIYSNGFSSNNYLRNSLDWLLNAFLGLCVFLLTAPVMLLTIIAIKLEDGIKAPTLYYQERLGLDGIPFKIIKFRSMREDAEKNGAVWSVKNDSRVTKVGSFIRKFRIDELPQLYNIFNGDMGFVGPRPERPEFIRDLAKSIPYYKQRLNVKPGLTGWAQLKYPYGATEEDARQKLHFDLYYIKHRSILLDLHILLRTVEVVVFGAGR